MKRQGFIKGSAILLAMVLITKILGLLYKIPLTNLLGGTGMGYFASAFSVFTPVFAIVVSGIPSTMARLTAENYALERFSNMRHTKRTSRLSLTDIYGQYTASDDFRNIRTAVYTECNKSDYPLINMHICKNNKINYKQLHHCRRTADNININSRNGS